VYLGALCVQDGWINLIHRGDRCDLSLFQLGLRRLDYLLNEGFTIPVAFYFDCLSRNLRTVVYISSMGPIGYAVSSDRSEQAHCVAIASGAP